LPEQSVVAIEAAWGEVIQGLGYDLVSKSASQRDVSSLATLRGPHQ
jgi:hypothetical protein